MKEIIEEIIAERVRQVNVKGYSHERDDSYDGGELCGAGAAYALHASSELHPQSQGDGNDQLMPGWCWHPKYWKPTTPRRDLVKAAALIIAEIERFDRAAAKKE